MLTNECLEQILEVKKGADGPRKRAMICATVFSASTLHILSQSQALERNILAPN